MYKIICKDGRAKRATFTTVHGTVETPVFMNVGTAAAIKGAVATTDGRPPQIHELGSSDSYGFRRISGVLACRTSKD